MPKGLVHGRHDVGAVGVLVADLALGLDAGRPVDDHRIGGAALPGVALEHLVGRVEREGPTDRVVVVGLGRAEDVEVLEVVLHLVRDAVHELVLVDRTVRAALTRGAVVGDEDDQRVVELATLLEVVDQPGDLVVGVAAEPGVHLGLAAHDRLLVFVERVPRAHDVDGATSSPSTLFWPSSGLIGESSVVLRYQAELLLTFEDALADRFVALVEAALVLVDPLLRRVVRRVPGAGAEVHEERAVGRDLLRVGDHGDRTVDQVLRQVVVVVPEARRPVLRRVSGLVDDLLVLHEVGVPLVGLSAEVPVEALEAAAGRPVALRRCHVRLVLGDDVPLADRVRVVAPLAEHLGDRRGLERDVPVRAGEAGRRFGDAGHPDRRVVASREQRRARRRADRRRVELRVPQPSVAQPLHRRHLDRTAERLQCAEADVVPHDEQDVRRAIRRLRLLVRRPVGSRIADVEVDGSVELGHDSSNLR